MLKLLVAEFFPSIIALQETHFKNHNIRYYKNSNNEVHASKGVAMYINNFYETKQITLVTDLKTVIVTLYGPTKAIICSVYLPPHLDLNMDINVANQISSEIF